MEHKKEQPFDNYPAFYQDDNRRNRGFNPTSKIFLEAKFSTLLPKNHIEGLSILDLGSGNGAAGQWALSNGAKHYTGIEVQKNYASQSQQLLAHWEDNYSIIQQDIRSYLQDAPDNSFDLVLLAGVLYHFIDTKHIIDPNKEEKR